jgi:hypothetical protein
VISISFLFISIVGAIESLVSIGLTGPSGLSSPPPHAVNRLVAVHNQMAFIVVEAIGVIVFILVGMIVGVVVAAVGNMVLIAIHVLVKTSLTAFLVLSKNLEDLSV